MSIGAQLREAREAKGLSLDQLAARTRIQVRLLDSIERQNLAEMPPRPYARGFVAAYAREVGLDPGETMRAYFAQFVPPPAKAHIHPPDGREGHPYTRRQWAAAAAVLLLVAGLGAVRLWTGSGDAPAERGAVGTSGTLPSAPAPAVLTSRATSPTTAVAAIRQPDAPLVVVLEADRPSWIAASADGATRVYRIVQPGTRETLQATRDIVIRVGDAGAVRWSVNGLPPRPMGRDGEVRTERVVR